MLDYKAVKNWQFQDLHHTYDQRDTMLYALGIGLGAQPDDHDQLRYVYEKDLVTVPSMASILAWSGSWMRDPKTGIDYVRLVHGEQDVRIHTPLPTEAEVVGRSRVSRVVDKGEGKGAIVELIRELYTTQGEHLASVRQITFCRADGGYAADSSEIDAPPEVLPAIPDRSPDIEIALTSVPQAALIYRLSGDWNPLHSDPVIAKQAGFTRPILHGLCTYGMATHAVLQACCDYDARRLRRMAVRFSSPVYPGETVNFQIWHASAGQVHVRARVDARDVTVLNNGWFELEEKDAA